MQKPFKSHDGSTSVIIHKGKILLLKRRSLPFIVNPGIWWFPGGHRERGETYADAAYREIEEETGIKKTNLILLVRPEKMRILELKNGRLWENMFFIFYSKTNRIKLDIENKKYRWAAFNELVEEKNFTNAFADRTLGLKVIKKQLKRKEPHTLST